MATFLGIDYATWWFLVTGAVFTGYAILDGFDLGAGALHLLFKKEESRRIALNAIGPVWDGNEVWLIIGGGALFAGFPLVYASMFSAFYIPFMLFLVSLIFRAISIEFRSKEKMLWWRKMWDISYSVSSILITILLGVVVGNLVQGIPLNEEHEFTGSFLEFLNPYALLVAITTLALFMMHGSMYLLMKTEDRLYAKLTVIGKKTTIFFVVSFALLTVVTLLYFPYIAERFKSRPWLFVVPLIAILAVANITRMVAKRKYSMAFLMSSISAALLLIMVAIGLYPNIVISTIDPANNITVELAAASEKSLGIMLTIAAIGTPLVVAYTAFVFYTFRGKVKLDENSY